MTTPLIIDGKAIAQRVLDQCAREAVTFIEGGRPPGLAVVIVGEDPASHAYVRAKERACERLGFYSRKLAFPASISQEELLAAVAGLNADSRIDGILVQSPLPDSLDEEEVVVAIDPNKDVDGFHPVNVAKLALGDPSGFVPCTPLGCQRLLMESGIAIAGAHVVVLGRSRIVGLPLSLLLVQKSEGGNATVTIAHSRSQEIEELARSADILVAAMGRAQSVGVNFVREGAVVIDVGINRVADFQAPKGYRLVGDVDFEAVVAKCRAITPVPGGVGPMTIAMLMCNTLKARRARG